MKKTNYYCDHCGKIVDDMSGYTDMYMDFSDSGVHYDLCNNCMRALAQTVMMFLGKESEAR